MYKDKIPTPITIEWLKEEDSTGVPNAHRLVVEEQLTLIPNDLLKDALAIKDRNKKTTLHYVALEKKWMQSVPPEMFNEKNLTRPDIEGWTPVMVAAGAKWVLQTIPWDQMNAEKWAGREKGVESLQVATKLATFSTISREWGGAKVLGTPTEEYGVPKGMREFIARVKRCEEKEKERAFNVHMFG